MRIEILAVFVQVKPIEGNKVFYMYTCLSVKPCLILS